MTNTTEKMPERIYAGRVRNNNIVAFTATLSNETEYIRADLAIPRADVMELVRGLEVIAEISQDNAPAYQLIQNIDATAIKALTNFKQKYGE